MEYLIGALVVFLALSPVIVPFFRPSEEDPAKPERDELQELLAEKQVLYAAIKELDFDHRAGKLALEDYQDTRRSYELRAVALLERIDRLGGQSASEDATSRLERSR
ncbi:MAG: hypothetical protein ACREJ6_11280 [Candidatus Methylomirabilis sp.]